MSAKSEGNAPDLVGRDPPAMRAGCSGTQFTCCTITKVQILALLVQKYKILGRDPAMRAGCSGSRAGAVALVLRYW